MVMSGDIESLIDFFSFTVSFFYAMAMAALLVLRKTRPNLDRPYKVPIVIPVVVMVVSILLVIAPIVDNPKIEYIYSIAFVVVGGLTYVPFVRYRVRVPFLGESCFSRVSFSVPSPPPLNIAIPPSPALLAFPVKVTQCLQMIFKVTPSATMQE